MKSRRSWLMGLALGAALFFGTPSAKALPGVPGAFTYQGLLAENGLPLTGTQSLTFTVSLADQSGTVLYTETLNGQPVVDGIFNLSHWRAFVSVHGADVQRAIFYDRGSYRQWR